LFIGRYCTALPETNPREALTYSDFVAIRRCSQEISPRHHVGARLHKRILNVITDFRGVNQRMHDKTFIVDRIVGITVERNMADEYFSYGRDYNFRDRDAGGNAVRRFGVNAKKCQSQ
jgi:phosphatidylserine/phosphatidylglycerophosphate/cardiolipin synthase-like enzyme